MSLGDNYVPSFYPTLQQIKNSNSVSTLLLWQNRIIVLQHDCVRKQYLIHSSLKLAKLRYCRIAKKSITYRINCLCETRQQKR